MLVILTKTWKPTTVPISQVTLQKIAEQKIYASPEKPPHILTL